MTTPNNFDRVLQAWLGEAAPSSAPAGLHARTMGLARQRRQRIAWTVAARDALNLRPSVRVSYVVRVAAVTVLTLLLGLAFLAGIGQRPPFVLLAPTPTTTHSPSPTVSLSPTPSPSTSPSPAPSAPTTLAPTSAQPRPTDSARPPGRNGLIAYELWDIDTRPYSNLHLMNPDGTDDREIGQGAGPSFAGDGQSLGYSTGYGLGAPLQRLFVADGDGTNPRDVAAYQEGGFAFAPDGSQFVVGESDALWLVSAEDGSRTLLVPAPESPAIHVFDMTWSPDSRVIAYSVMEEVTSGDNSGWKRVAIDVVDVDTQVVNRLTSRVGTDATGITWSPDSARIAFLALPDGAPEPSLGTGPGGGDEWWQPEDVFVVGSDGTGERNVTNTEGFELEPEWSPDGVSLAFKTFVDPEYRIAVVDVSDTSGDMLIGPAAEEYEWSPDGQQLLLAHVADVSPPGAENQTLNSTISVIDAGFETPEETLLEAAYNVGSLAWQWLTPE